MKNVRAGMRPRLALSRSGFRFGNWRSHRQVLFHLALLVRKSLSISTRKQVILLTPRHKFKNAFFNAFLNLCGFVEDVRTFLLKSGDDFKFKLPIIDENNNGSDDSNLLCFPKSLYPTNNNQ